MKNQNDNINTINLQIQSCKQEVALYIVATPIGNMDDITIRALNTLANIDYIACEDTRVTNKLLAKFGIKKKLICYNDHSSKENRNYIADLIKSGHSVALTSDAGTPLISDPGYKLIRHMYDNNLKVTSIPGASSVTTALSLCGLPTDRFLFEGFLPAKKESRKNSLKALKEINASLIFFESARRLTDCLKDIGEILKDREISVLRELTKKFEEVRIGKIDELVEYYMNNVAKGEIVIIVSPPKQITISDDEITLQLQQALRSMSVKDAVNLVSDNCKANKKDIYKIALNLHAKSTQ
jgi:16S rRNA (cytidine1402-2'-O)-methyltransferase